MADNQNRLRNVNTVDIEKLDITLGTGEVFDLRHIFTQVNIFENIYSNVLTGHILITEGVNIVSQLGICGREVLNIVWKTPGRETSSNLIFQIYKVSDRSQVAERAKTYKLHFMSLEGIKDSITRIDKRYFDTIDSIVFKVFNEFLQPVGGLPGPTGALIRPETDRPWHGISWSATGGLEKASTRGEYNENIITVLVPGWSPLKLINWLCKRAIRPETGNADYLFFETVNGFNFASLSQLAEYHVAQDYVQSISPVRPPGDARSRDIDLEFRTFERYSISDSFNMLKHTQNASFASRLITHDIVTKKIEEHTYDYLERSAPPPISGANIPISTTQYHKNLEDYPILPKNSILPKQAKVNTLFYPKHTNLQSQDTFVKKKETDIHSDKWLQERLSNLGVMGHVKVVISVPGDTGQIPPGGGGWLKSRSVGDVVNLHLPSVEHDPSDFEADPYLKGKYMITAIRHIISLEEYKLEMELSKDSLPRSLSTDVLSSAEAPHDGELRANQPMSLPRVSPYDRGE